jgi:hypothetical protein
MEHVSDQCWARLEAVRHRMKSICNASDRAELASLDAEIVEVRDFVFTSLRSSEDASPVEGN